MRYLAIAFWMLLASITAAEAQVTVGIGVPGLSIGINFPVYPQLVPVPGYPVYYAPQANSNYFFYDGMYWVYQQDNWYASSWYNGPWQLVMPEVVPLYVLRVPVRYYRRPPAYFHGWRSDAPPRWGDHWGNSWQQQHEGWDRWDRHAVPAPAPLPTYQRQYSGSHYPQLQQQQQLQSQNYRYQPKDAVVQQHYQAQQTQTAPAVQPRPDKSVPSQGYSRPPSVQQPNPVTPSNAPARAGGGTQRPVTTNAPAERSGAAAQPPRAKPQQEPTAQRQPGQPQGKAPTQESNVSVSRGSRRARRTHNERAAPADAIAASRNAAPAAGTEGTGPGQACAGERTRAGTEGGTPARAAAGGPASGQGAGQERRQGSEGQERAAGWGPRQVTRCDSTQRVANDTWHHPADRRDPVGRRALQGAMSGPQSP